MNQVQKRQIDYIPYKRYCTDPSNRVGLHRSVTNRFIDLSLAMNRSVDLRLATAPSSLIAKGGVQWGQRPICCIDPPNRSIKKSISLEKPRTKISGKTNDRCHRCLLRKTAVDVIDLISVEVCLKNLCSAAAGEAVLFSGGIEIFVKT